MGRTINALDLFSGAGGLSTGMEQAGVRVVAAVESVPQIADTYRHNHPDTHVLCGDIRDVETAAVTALFRDCGLTCDLIFGGPPCQGFSMAGRRIRQRRPFLEDPRNELFKEFIRMVGALRPMAFVLENVPGILNYDGGRVRREIIEAFSALGYDVCARVLCAADYGVPQTRRRAFFLGTRLGFSAESLFPLPTHDAARYVTVWDAISDLPPLRAGEGCEPAGYTGPAHTPYQRLLRTGGGSFYNHVSAVHKPETLELLAMIAPGQTMRDLPERYHTRSVHSGAYGRMRPDQPAYTLTTRLNTPSVGRITHPEQDRTITPREAARLQSFPDGYRFLGDITSVGIQIGNAVPPLLAQSIGEALLAKIAAVT